MMLQYQGIQIEFACHSDKVGAGSGQIRNALGGAK
jgi:hypothetical protein